MKAISWLSLSWVSLKAHAGPRKESSLFVPLTRNRPAINYEYAPVD